MSDLRRLDQGEYGWDRENPDGSLDRGQLYVDEDGTVRWQSVNVQDAPPSEVKP